MHINCPHCHNGVEVVDEASLADIDCPSCGSHFSILGEDPDATFAGPGATTTIGRFELVNEVGKGAFGSVWRGKDPELDRTVAVKIPRKGQLNKEESEQFFREARAAAQLKHPNIVPVHEIGKDGDTIYIVSDFVQGISLAGWLTAKQMSMRESAELCIRVCRALNHAHEKGVIHRDLKPGNIMLDDQGQPHVMDFGLAKRDAGEITMTVDGQVLGTPAYMSPEQARGSAHDADGRSDLYSVGVILFQLLTGELPFRGNTRMLIHQVINDDAPSPLKLNSNIDKDLATITSKCMEKDPDNRYATANELAGDLQRYLDGEPIRARPISGLERGWRWCQRKPALSGALALSTLLLTTLAIGGPIVAVQQAALKQRADDATEKAVDEKNRANDEAANARAAEAKAKQSAKRSSDVLRIVTDSFNSTNPEEGSTAQMTAKDVLFNAQESLRESELDDAGRVELLTSLTTPFLRLGEYNSAISTATRAVAIRKAKLGEDHPHTLSSMNSLALAYMSAGRLEEALPLYETTLAARKAKLGEDHPLTLISMHSLALAYKSAGRLEEALPLLETTLAARKAKLGEDHPHTLGSMNSLALAYQSAGRLEEALPLLETTLAARKAKLGEDHPRTLGSMNSLALACMSAGRLEEALPLYEKTLAAFKAKLGEDHPHTLISMHSLALAYQSAGRLEEALPLLETTLAAQQAKLGEDHPSTLRSMHSLALAYMSAGRLEEALPLLETTLAAFKAKLGDDHPSTLSSMHNLAVALIDNNENAKAEKLLRELLNIRQTTSPDSWTTSNSQSRLGQALLGQEKFVEAKQPLDDGYIGLKDRAGKIPPSIRPQRLSDALQRLIHLAEATDNQEDLKKWQQELEELERLQSKPPKQEHDKER